MRSIHLFPLSLVLATAVSAAWAADDETVTIDQVPKAVKPSILAAAGNAKIVKIEKETSQGKTVYEAEWMNGKDEVEITVAEDGTVLEHAREADDDAKEKGR